MAKLCNSSKNLQKKYGEKCAKGIMKKLQFLSDAESLNDVSPLPPHMRHELQGKDRGKIAIDALNRSDPNRIVFEPNYAEPPRLEDGGYDLKAIKSICIIFIGDYHK